MICIQKPAPAHTAKQPAVLTELKEGLKVVLRHPFSRPLAFCSGCANVFINMHLAIYILHLTRQVGLSPAKIGILYSAGSIGGLSGALSVGAIARQIGLGR